MDKNGNKAFNYRKYFLTVFVLVFIASYAAFFISDRKNRTAEEPDTAAEETVDSSLPETDISSQDQEEEEQKTRSRTSMNFRDYVDFSTLESDDYINLNQYTNQSLPRTYTTSNTQYTTFASDKVTLGSNKETRVIVIDAGHQVGSRKSDVWLSPYLNPESDSSWKKNSSLLVGCTGEFTDIPEYETTHSIALYVKKALETAGYVVVLSHPDMEEQISGSERAAVANKNNADLMISLHIDSYDSDSRVSGAHAEIPALWDGYPSKNLQYLSSAAAKTIMKEYCNATGIKRRNDREIQNTAMFSFCKCPVFILEMGFSSNEEEDKNMNTVAFQKTIADAILSGVNRYFALIQAYDETH